MAATIEPSPPRLGYDAPCDSSGTVPVDLCRKGPPPGVQCLLKFPSGASVGRGLSGEYGADMCCEKNECQNKSSALPATPEYKEAAFGAGGLGYDAACEGYRTVSVDLCRHGPPAGVRCIPKVLSGGNISRGPSGEYGADMCCEKYVKSECASLAGNLPATPEYQSVHFDTQGKSQKKSPSVRSERQEQQKTQEEQGIKAESQRDGPDHAEGFGPPQNEGELGSNMKKGQTAGVKYVVGVSKDGELLYQDGGQEGRD